MYYDYDRKYNSEKKCSILWNMIIGMKEIMDFLKFDENEL